MKKPSSLFQSILEILRDAEDQGVQIRLAHPDKLRLVGPDESVDKIKPRVLENKTAILEHLQSDPWSWHAAPHDPDDKDAIEWWATVEYLRKILAYEGWTLGRIGKTLIVPAEPWFTPSKIQRLHVAIDGLRACWPVLCSKTEFFPELAPAQAKSLLERIEGCHGSEGFRLLGWNGLALPKSWPTAIWSMLYTIYAQALQFESDGRPL
jgi:hypothetical protein